MDFLKIINFRTAVIFLQSLLKYIFLEKLQAKNLRTRLYSLSTSVNYSMRRRKWILNQSYVIYWQAFIFVKEKCQTAEY